MATLQPYKKYNVIAYDYARQLPDGWQLLPNIAVFQERKERGTENEENLTISAIRGIVKSTDYENRKDRTSDDKSQYLLVKEGDLAYNTMLMWDGAVGHSSFRGIVSPAYTVLKAKMKINPKFFHYQMRTEFYKNYSRRFSYGIVDARLRLYYVHFKRMYSIVPPIEVQNSIVAYLDKKNNEIDKFILNKERLIELLEEEKQSVIRKGVTKGLNAKIFFKETEIDWVGKIHENWNIKRLKYCSQIIYGISPHENTYNDKAIGSVLVNGPVEYSDEGFGYTRELKWTTDPKKFAPKNALLFCLRGSTTGRLNICHDDVSIGRGVAAIISSTNQDFMVYAIKALVDFISDSFKGSTFPSVISEDLNNYLIPLPATIEEEIEIVNFLNEETKMFDLAISKAKIEILSIKEYREALITDLVTGKRSVPQLQMN